MQEVFEKIIEKLDEYEYENLVEHDSEQSQHCKDAGDCKGMDCSLCVFNKAIEIVKQEAEQYEECYKDCRECEAYNKEKYHCPKFCKVIKEAVKEIEENRNGWISCSEQLPEERDWYLAVFEEVDTGFIGIPYIADYLMGSHTKFTTEDGWIIHNCSDREDESAEYYKSLRCVAWQPLPQPYQQKGE